MFGKAKRLERENLLLKARINELENLLCPGESHEYKKVHEEWHSIDGHGTLVYDRRYVCQRCFNVMERREFS